jgi:hypothetical protein
MKRLSRHTVVVLVVALLSSVGGLTLAVVAFGQSGTTPPSSTLSPYATTPTATTPVSTTPTKTSTTPTEATTTNGNNPERTHGRVKAPVSHGGLPPSRATRNGPTHLAFTGGEPIYVALFGATLMVGGLMLHRRRRAATER